MASEKTKLGITKFLSSLFSNFPRLLLVNLLFSVPLIGFSCLFYFLGRVLGFQNIMVLALCVIPVMPFYAGVTMVTRNMIRGDESVEVLYTYFKGIKENWVRFLIHGVLFYLAFVMSYFSIALYGSFAQQNGMFYGVMGVCIIISVLFLFTFYNIPLMTVTFDMSMKDIYKNCFLMSFGELKSNFLASIGVFLLAIFCLSFLIFSGTSLWVIILTLIFVAFLIPGVTSFIINYAEYKGMMSLLVAKEEKKAELEKEILYKKNPALKKQEEAKKFRDDFGDVVIDESANGDEYVFHNGKMVKRSVLIRQLKEAGKVIDEEKKP